MFEGGCAGGTMSPAWDVLRLGEFSNNEAALEGSEEYFNSRVPARTPRSRGVAAAHFSS